MNQQQRKQLFSTRIEQPLNLPDIDTLDTLDTMTSKLTVIHHTLSHGMLDIEDELLQGLVNLVEEVQGNLAPITQYCEQAEDVIFPLWRNLQALGPLGCCIFEMLCEIDHDQLIQKSFFGQLYDIKKKREKAAEEEEVAK